MKYLYKQFASTCSTRFKNFISKLSHEQFKTISILSIIILLIAATLVFQIEHTTNDLYKRFGDGLWWAIVTMTTTGYGDLYPKTDLGRVVAAMLMIIGIITMGIITGNISSWLIERKLKEGRGLKNFNDKKNHFVICGWKKEMQTIIDEIMLANPNLTPENIVIIAPIDQETYDSFFSNPRFTKVNVLRGEYYHAHVLENANIKKASKVMIFAHYSGYEQNFTEVDGKTILTAMTIEKIAPKVHVVAELLDKSFENYLQMTHCDEIIYSFEYSRTLIANSSRSIGIAHVIHELLDLQSSSSIKTKHIPEEFTNKDFRTLFDYFKSSSKSILIGLLENTGNFHSIKQEVLEEAQKSPEVRQILSDLKNVKHLKSNLPVINPEDTYRIKKHSLAIVIEPNQLSFSTR